MRRRDRELNIFSMSALDLFASALGAFILITLILMPYYKRQTPTPPDQPTCPAPQVCPPRQVCEVCPEPQVIEIPMVMDKLLMVQMIWARKVDIDLHVKTPEGEFYYRRPLISGAPGQLAADDTNGGTSGRPAREIWVTFEPTPGNYEICFNYFSGSGATQVWGKLLKPSGPEELNRVTLHRSETKCVARFHIDSEFQVDML